VVTIGVLEQARACFAQRSWAEAYQLFAKADAAAPLILDDLERLALAGYLSGLDEESTLAWTRAHHEAPSSSTNIEGTGTGHGDVSAVDA
jgi:hypothetical protein